MASRSRKRKPAAVEVSEPAGEEIADDIADNVAAATEPEVPVARLPWYEDQSREVADAGLIPPSQAVPVVGVPSYPNCLKWSKENLLAAGAGHLVTILNPAHLTGPRGFIPVATGAVVDIGRVQLEDLHSHSLLHTCLSRDPRPIVRSIDWSPPGLAQNGGSLLAVCSTNGRVKVYREPFCDFQSEWVEILDLTEIMFRHCFSNDFRDAEAAAAKLAVEEAEIPPPLKWGFKLKGKASQDEGPPPRKRQKTKQIKRDELALVTDCRLASVENDGVDDTVGDVALEHSGMISLNGSIETIQKGSRVEVLEEENDLRIWVDGVALDIRDKKVLVQVDHPDDGSKQKWIPCHVQDDLCVRSDVEVALETRRPLVRPHLVTETLDALDVTLVAGELVEAWLDSSWREGVVVEVSGSDVVVSFAASLPNAVIGINKLRLAPTWNAGEGWWTWSHMRTENGREGDFLGVRNGHKSADGEDNGHLTVADETRDIGLREGQQQSPKDGGDRSTEGWLVAVNAPEESIPVTIESGDIPIDGDQTPQVGLAQDNHGKIVQGDGGTGIKRAGVSRLFGKRGKLFHSTNQEGQVTFKWISAHDYAARVELLTPMIVAWSSQFPRRDFSDKSKGEATKTFALLGAGTKSGKVAVWRMAFPTKYAIDKANTPVVTDFMGFLPAHESWVTTLSWASCCNFDLGKLNARVSGGGDGRSGDTLLLATGCVDGSFKLWAGLNIELGNAPTADRSVPFVLLEQVIMVDSVPTTAMELIVPSRRKDRALLAVGNASGSVAIWVLGSEGMFRQVCSQRFAHQQMVAGFSWSTDGRSLYSCGQDSMKRWDFSQDQLVQLPFPDSRDVIPPSTTADVCSLEALESYFGLTLSPNGLALAAIRGVANDLLDQMYQARSQKGMLQLYWLGNEHLDVTEDTGRNLLPSKSVPELRMACWETNIIEALEDLQDASRPLVLWDVVKSLSSLKDRVGVKGVVTIISKWVSSWASNQETSGGLPDSIDLSIQGLEEAISGVSCRRLQVLNVVARCLFFSHIKPDVLNSPELSAGIKMDGTDMKFWREGLFLLEQELRQRLVHISLCRASVGDGTNSVLEGQAGDVVAGTQLLAAWVLRFGSSMTPQLLKLAAKLCDSNE